MVGVWIIIYTMIGMLAIGLGCLLKTNLEDFVATSLFLFWPIYLVIFLVWLLFKGIVHGVKFIKSWNWSTKS